MEGFRASVPEEGSVTAVRRVKLLAIRTSKLLVWLYPRSFLKISLPCPFIVSPVRTSDFATSPDTVSKFMEKEEEEEEEKEEEEEEEEEKKKKLEYRIR
ncbi:hypothetical protein TREES_T100018433 [Tupaia chinensis]|uniref:Uncharacterized protein n=1 Tax=Tupaia chinensis TaxID=246437 RepID=L9L2Q3_TUPCH|nr:hypothetical protein TREES_T100018433 [Tupaia chinensis]